MDVTTREPIDIADAPEIDAPTDAIALRRTDVPTTISELAARTTDAPAILAARVQIIETLRKASIRATSPPDWVLFKSPDEQGGQIVGYLQDGGCDRARDLWGINIFDVGRPEKIIGSEPGQFHYLITGSGRCDLTRQVVEAIEGGRSSTDDFCKGKTGAELELLVRKAARANLDGNITRELAGMKAVPIDDLRDAWVGTNKSIDQCRRGRGFGTHSERLGARTEKAPDVDPPVCPHCHTPGVYRAGKDGRKAFYGCPKYTTHPQKKFIVDAEQWIAEQQKKAAAGEPPSAAEVFGGRQPGEEG